MHAIAHGMIGLHTSRNVERLLSGEIQNLTETQLQCTLPISPTTTELYVLSHALKDRFENYVRQLVAVFVILRKNIRRKDMDVEDVVQKIVQYEGGVMEMPAFLKLLKSCMSSSDALSITSLEWTLLTRHFDRAGHGFLDLSGFMQWFTRSSPPRQAIIDASFPTQNMTVKQLVQFVGKQIKGAMDLYPSFQNLYTMHHSYFTQFADSEKVDFDIWNAFYQTFSDDIVLDGLFLTFFQVVWQTSKTSEVDGVQALPEVPTLGRKKKLLLQMQVCDWLKMM